MMGARVEEDQVLRRLSILSVVLALVATLLPATVYFWVAYADQRTSLTWEADVVAKELADVINRNPAHWEYNIDLRTVIESDYGKKGIQGNREIYAGRGELISQAGRAAGTPWISETRALYDAGDPVGSLHITRSLQPILVRALYISLFSFFFAAAIHTIFKTVPLSTMRASFMRLKEEKERALVTLKSVADAVIITSPELRVESLNPVAEELTGWSSEGAKGRSLHEVIQIVDEELDQVVRHMAYQCLVTGRTAEREKAVALIRKSDGVKFYIQDSAAPIRMEDGSLVGVVVALHDVTVHIQAQQHLNQLAHHDALTGLLNRHSFQERISLAVSSAKRHHHPFAIFFLDLDRFKEVNDTHGHDAGDRLLIDVAVRISQCIRNTDMVMRLGGDEFAVLLEGVHEAPDLSSIAKNIVAGVSRPFRIGEHEVCITTSIGIAVFPKDGDDIATLVKNADTAMYRAKSRGRNAYEFFDSV